MLIYKFVEMKMCSNNLDYFFAPSSFIEEQKFLKETEYIYINFYVILSKSKLQTEYSNGKLVISVYNYYYIGCNLTC